MLISVWRSDVCSSDLLPWIRQIFDGNDTIIGAKSYLDNGAELIDVVVFHFNDEGQVILRQDAATAKLEDGYWALNDVLENRPGETSVRVDSVQLSTNLKREFLQESLSQPEAVAFFDLSRKKIGSAQV